MIEQSACPVAAALLASQRAVAQQNWLLFLVSSVRDHLSVCRFSLAAA